MSVKSENCERSPKQIARPAQPNQASLLADRGVLYVSVTPAANSEPLIRNDETMRYRPLGRTGLMVSALSFGCMRLGEDQELNTTLISRAIDLGVNYFETTRIYCGGQCQHRIAPGLVGKTQGVIVSGKDGIGPDTTAYQFRKEMERQLDILGVSHFKFYQVGWFGWQPISYFLKRGGVLDALRQAKDEGLVQHFGFTGHDKPENFTKCVETGLFDSITVSYNLINRSYEPTIARAGELGVGVIAMSPVAGGVLACESSKLREGLKMDMPTTQMAMRFVLSNPNVSTACSGMSTMEMLEENVETVRQFDPERDSAHEQMCEGTDRLREALGDHFCTGCSYCLPCPQGIHIPYLMELHRNWKAFDLGGGVRSVVQRLPENSRPTNCNECRTCEEACPNGLGICDAMAELAGLAAEKG